MGRFDPNGPNRAGVLVYPVGKSGAISDDVIRQAAAILDEGGVIAMPTDTVYGLAASIDRPDALARLYAIKGRPDDRPLPVLLANAMSADLVAEPVGARLTFFLDRFWPGGLTVALPARPGLKSPLRAVDGTVGVRVPDHPVTLALLRAAGGALAVTSANPTGLAPATCADAVVAALGVRLDLVLDAGEAPGGAASTVIGFDQEQLRLYRQGVVAWSEVRAAWEDAGGQVVASGPGTVG